MQDTGARPTSRQALAIFSVTLGTMLTTLSGSMINVALPVLSRELKVGAASVVLLVTVYQLVQMMALLPFSALGDRFGHRRVYQWGQATFVAATLLSFFAHNLPFLVVVRAIQSLGAAASLGVSSALIRAIYSPQRLGRGLALNTVSAAGAAAFAPTFGGAILAFADWPWLFAALVPFGVISILAGRSAIPEPERRENPFDMVGVALCATTFGIAVWGLEVALRGHSPVMSVALLTAGLAIGTFFIRRELRQSQPVLPVDLLAVSDVSIPMAALFIGYMASTIILLTLPFRLQLSYGFSPVEAGAVLAPWPLVTMFSAPVAGSLSDRYSVRTLGSLGMAIGVAGLGSLAFLPPHPTHIDVIWRIMLCGLGFGMFYTPNGRQVVAAAPLHRAAAAGALGTTSRGLSQTLSATAVSALLAAGLGNDRSAAIIAATLAAIAGIGCLFVRQRPR